MPRTKQAPIPTFDASPLRPLTVDANVWLPADTKLTKFRLGNKASVEEISGSVDPIKQSWRWRVCAFGGETSICTQRDAAMRAAEFALGLGEMPVQLPEVAATANRKGGRA